MSDTKPLLILAAVALGLVALLLLVPGDSDFSIMGYFNELVDECQAGHPDGDRAVCEGIVRQEVWEGMTSEMLIASLGEPRRVDTPRASHPEYEEWTYHSVEYGEERMMLIDGILVDWDQVPCDSCAAKPPRN